MKNFKPNKHRKLNEKNKNLKLVDLYIKYQETYLKFCWEFQLKYRKLIDS